MFDHRLLLISLLAAYLAFQAVLSLFPSSPEPSSASRLPLIEVEPDAVTPDEG